MFHIVAIKINPRTKFAPKVQEILTEYGNIINTRIGLHEASNKTTSQNGLIILNLSLEKDQDMQDLLISLNSLDGVDAKSLSL